jgi:hypothetical protein
MAIGRFDVPAPKMVAEPEAISEIEDDARVRPRLSDEPTDSVGSGFEHGRIKVVRRDELPA